MYIYIIEGSYELLVVIASCQDDAMRLAKEKATCTFGTLEITSRYELKNEEDAKVIASFLE